MRRLALILGFLLVFVESAWADVVAHVHLWSRTMDVSVDGVQRYSWPVATARFGYPTPLGEYHPVRLERVWYSTIYDNAPMPFAIFFMDGYAIHGTNDSASIGRRASHGCVRLETASAATLFALVRRQGFANTSIVITRF